MHSLLQPILPTGITIVLWCVCSGAAALVQPSKNNEPQQLPDSPTTPFTVVVRTIPITKELAFEERWQVPAPETMPPTDVSLRLEPDQRASQHAEPAIRSAATRVAATFTLLEFCHGSAIDEQQPQRRRAIWLAEVVEFGQD
jgi:hypothetical protein